MNFPVFATILAIVASTTAIIAELDRKTNGMMIPLTIGSRDLENSNVDFDTPPSAHIESVDANLAVEGTELMNLKKRAAASAAALTSHQNLFWYGTITIGTPPKSFTGMSTFNDLFLPGPTCAGYSGQTHWDPTSSSTAEVKGSTFHIRFADGATASGNQYTDNVTIAGLTVDVQTIGVATAYSTAMGSPSDGMLGMGFRSMSSYPASPVFETLVNEGKLTEPVFSLKLASDGGELYLGGTNGELYEGEIIYTPVTEVVNIRKIRGDHQTIVRDATAIIDSGANMIIGDPSQVANLHRTLGGKSVGRGYYSFPCNDFPTISFYLGGGRMFRIPASILNHGPIRVGSPDCFSAIVGRGKRGLWSLGVVFLRSVYTVFDFGNQRVGFANLV